MFGRHEGGHGRGHRRRPTRLRRHRLVHERGLPRQGPPSVPCRARRGERRAAGDRRGRGRLADRADLRRPDQRIHRCDALLRRPCRELRLRVGHERHRLHGPAPAADPPEGSGGGGRCDHAVELPALPEPVQDRAGAGRGLHDGAEAAAGHAVVCHRARAALCGEDGPSGRRAQHRRQLRPHVGRDPDDRPARGRHHLHRKPRPPRPATLPW